MNERCTAVLGWQDKPTDAVEEYCQYLRGGLAAHGIELELMRVPWPEMGWGKALRDLREKIKASPNNWFLLQYTALAWSRRGFPLRALSVIRALKQNGARCAVVFHDPAPYPGSRFVDKLRRTVQLHTMRTASLLADLTILTVPRDKLAWIPKGLENVAFIPVGANLPSPEQAWPLKDDHQNDAPTIGVFSISSGSVGSEEIGRIAEALRYASMKMGSLRLAVLGRNSETGGKQLQEKLAGSKVEVVIHGLLKAEQVVQKLGQCDVFLFARGPISTRRGSAIAGIACGLPVVACGGWETASPITEAGIVLLTEDSTNDYGPALVRVLSDANFRTSLVARSRLAQQQYFSWAAIATGYAAALRKKREH